MTDTFENWSPVYDAVHANRDRDVALSLDQTERADGPVCWRSDAEPAASTSNSSRTTWTPTG